MAPLPPRGTAALASGAGGVGKTVLGITTALCVTTGHELLGLPVYARGEPVAILALEESEDHVKRLITACRDHHRLNSQAGCHQLFIYNEAASDSQTPFVTMDKEGKIVPTRRMQQLENNLIEHGICLLIVDPFDFTHDQNENDCMKTVLQLWNGLAQRANCVVLLIHHMRKGGATVEDARGAGSLVNHARAAIALRRMTAGEAETHGIAYPGEFIKLSDAKLNHSAARDAPGHWFRLVSVQLANGDSVQAIEPWTAKIDSDQYVLSDDLREEINRRLPDGEHYSPHRQSKNRWVGRLLIKEFKINDHQAGELIKIWLKDGKLEERQYSSTKSRREVSRAYCPVPDETE